MSVDSGNARMQEGGIVLGYTAYSPHSPSGLNRFSGSILPRLLRDAGTEAWVTEGSLANGGRQTRVVGSPVHQRSDLRGNTTRLLWNQLRLPGMLAGTGASVYYSPLPEGMLRPSCAQVITVHDVLPLRYPATYPRLRHYFRFILPMILRACRAVVVNSETTRRDLVEFLGDPGVPIHVIPFGYDSATFAAVPVKVREEVLRRHGLADYVLAVGETRPYKNMRRLIEAFATVDSPFLTLALVGEISRRDPGIVDLPERLGIAERVRFLGKVSDPDLAALYSGANAFAFPSLYEGFGLPPLEAMACGCPVIASHIPALLETCGGAAVFVDPLDTDSIAAGISRVVHDASVRDSLRKRGHARAGTMPIRNTADRIADLLHGYAQDRGSVPRNLETNRS